jgi:hypothetical protein
MAQYTFELQPSYAYPFPDGYPIRVDDSDDCPEEPPPGRRGPTLLYGGLHATDGRGVAGATVSVDGGQVPYHTTESGQWVLWFREPQVNDPNPAPTGLVTVRVRLPGDPPLDVDVPAGATIAVSGQAGLVGTDAQGAWSYYFDLNQPAQDTLVSVTATLPDGTSQTHEGVAVRRRATVVVPTFSFP